LEFIGSLRKQNASDIFFRYGIYVVLIVLIIVFTVINGRFASPENAINILQQCVSIGIGTCGLLFVLIPGGLDISMGSVMYLGAIVGAYCTTNLGLGLGATIFICMICGALVGTANGLFVAKLKIAPLIVTLAMLYIVRGIVMISAGISTVKFANPVADTIIYTRLFDKISVIIVILAVILVVSQYILSKTVYGRQLYAMGNNRVAANMLGIKVDRNLIITYIISGAFSSLAGLISGAQVGNMPTYFASGKEFVIISAAILGGASLFGGRGSAFPGMFIGVLIITIIENGLVMSGTDLYAYVVVRGIIIFLAVLMDSIRNKGDLR